MKKILVVDDDEGILDAIGILLENYKYEVELSQDGEIIKNLDNKNLPDLILLDMLLSGTDGRELCRIVKNQEHTKHIPVIMFSAHPNASETVKFCGADEFISKPFEMDELLSKVKKIFVASNKKRKKADIKN